MKNQYIKNRVIVMALVAFVAMMVVGCGKKTPAASAVSNPEQVVTTTQTTTTVETPTTVPTDVVPTSTPTAEPTKKATWTPTTNVSFECQLEMPEDDRAYLERLENTHVGPFLNGFQIEQRLARVLGRPSGYNKYLITYVCKRGDLRLTFEFQISQIWMNADNTEDTIDYDSILLEGLYEGSWTVISEWRNPTGLTGHGVD